MTPLRQALHEYLTMRRALGFQLLRPEKLLVQYLAYLEGLGLDRVTTQSTIAWATLPAGGRSWHSYRLSVVRGFAVHLRVMNPSSEVPDASLLPWKRCRATPYLYSDEEVAAVNREAAKLRPPHRAATYRVLIGLLAVTGMRIGEAIGLDHGDFDPIAGLLVVRRGKFGKVRELPLHSSTVKALRGYVRRRDRPPGATNDGALMVSKAGTRLRYRTVQNTFSRLVFRAGLRPRSKSCRPRIHDLRHSFAVRTLLDAYRDKGDAHAQILLLSTYLGHVDPGKTYWYLSAAPELLGLAGERLERHIGGGS